MSVLFHKIFFSFFEVLLLGLVFRRRAPCPHKLFWFILSHIASFRYLMAQLHTQSLFLSLLEARHALAQVVVAGSREVALDEYSKIHPPPQT